MEEDTEDPKKKVEAVIEQMEETEEQVGARGECTRADARGGGGSSPGADVPRARGLSDCTRTGTRADVPGQVYLAGVGQMTNVCPGRMYPGQ
ncbi:hypothetical protein AMTR_s00009p00264340 [Amborella trichopoda]|uniref:Uncharacterized protein n=1 Tax=Amborella trichopoda TaxID=13333 RepID=W1NJ04_AMBTC|nr:hypothetical protein AMTR_s00009p00264340 [Amborella trichopoda]